MQVATLLTGEGKLTDPVIHRIEDRLGSIGVISVKTELAGISTPEMELNGAVYFGESEINHGIDVFLDDRGH